MFWICKVIRNHNTRPLFIYLLLFLSIFCISKFFFKCIHVRDLVNVLTWVVFLLIYCFLLVALVNKRGGDFKTMHILKQRIDLFNFISQWWITLLRHGRIHNSFETRTKTYTRCISRKIIEWRQTNEQTDRLAKKMITIYSETCVIETTIRTIDKVVFLQGLGLGSWCCYYYSSGNHLAKYKCYFDWSIGAIQQLTCPNFTCETGTHIVCT